MKLRLLDYAGREYFCEVPDNTEQVIINIVSGDMIMINPVHFDTSNTRIRSFYDGTVTLSKEKFYKLNEVKNSYDLFQ